MRPRRYGRTVAGVVTTEMSDHSYRPCTTVRDQSDRLVTDEAGG